MSKEVSLVRPHFTLDRAFFTSLSDVTVLICQRMTVDLIRLTIESLLRFYPDINILVIDGNSKDDSILYLRYKAIICPNLKVVELTNDRVNSHGDTMDKAIRTHVHTKYVCLMDSDLIIHRGRFIEGMKEQIEKEDLYATGTLMLVSESGEACAPPKSESDTLRYAHPSCSLYKVEEYKTMRPFRDHGAPCVWNMIDAKHRGLKIGYYPVDKYVAHLSGASWTQPRTIWNNDQETRLNPFITFITDRHVEELLHQSDHDFDIVTTAPSQHIHIVIHGELPKEVNSRLYSIRFLVHGEYVCHLSDDKEKIANNIVHLAKLEAIKLKAPSEFMIGGLTFYKRTYWQQFKCFE